MNSGFKKSLEILTNFPNNRSLFPFLSPLFIDEALFSLFHSYWHSFLFLSSSLFSFCPLAIPQFSACLSLPLQMSESACCLCCP